VTICGTLAALERDMFALIRRFVIGWLLVRLFKRFTGGSAANRRR